MSVELAEFAVSFTLSTSTAKLGSVNIIRVNMSVNCKVVSSIGENLDVNFNVNCLIELLIIKSFLYRFKTIKA